MIFIKNLTKINEEKYSIGYTHFAPFDSECGLRKTKEELEKEGILVEVPVKNEDGKEQILYYNPKIKQCFWEEKKIEVIETPENLTLEERIAALEQSNAELTTLLSTMSTPTI